MKQVDKYARLVLPALMAVAAGRFFGVFYRWHLLYFEAIISSFGQQTTPAKRSAIWAVWATM